jgi:hypothetical protein
MDEQLLTQALREIAEQEIPDTMNLYPQIAAQAEKTMLRAARARGAWVLVAAAMLLLTAAAAFAVVRWQISDPGLEGAQAADLITPLDLEQTIDGVTVTLDYGYLDANRVSVGYTVSGELAPATQYVVKDMALRESSGIQLNTLFGYSETPPFSISASDTVEPFAFSGTATYDACNIDNSSETVPLQFAIALERWTFAQPGGAIGTIVYEPISSDAVAATAMMATIEPTIIALSSQPTPCGQYGSGGGGGGGHIARIEPIGPFIFDFSLPYIPAQVIDTPLTASAETGDISLERVSITPSFTRAAFCFADTLETGFDSVDVALQVGGEAIDLTEAVPSNMGFNGINSIVTLLPASAQLPRNCGEMLINQSLYEMDGEWALTIEALGARMGGIGMSYGDSTTIVEYSPPAEFLSTVEARLATLLPDVAIEPVAASEFQLGGVRVTLPAEQAAQLQGELDDVIVQQLEGPWVFRFTPS